jgi:LAO/AO transport system kinase
VLPTIATSGQGVAELMEAVDRFRDHVRGQEGTRRRSRAAFRLRELLEDRFLEHVERRVLGPGEMDAVVETIARRELDPYTAADRILARALRGS